MVANSKIICLMYWLRFCYSKLLIEQLVWSEFWLYCSWHLVALAQTGRLVVGKLSGHFLKLLHSVCLDFQYLNLLRFYRDSKIFHFCLMKSERHLLKSFGFHLGFGINLNPFDFWFLDFKAQKELEICLHPSDFWFLIFEDLVADLKELLKIYSLQGSWEELPEIYWHQDSLVELPAIYWHQDSLEELPTIYLHQDS